MGEHWGTTCSVLIPPSPSARLESLQPLELGLKAVPESQGFTSGPGKQCHSSLVKGQANARGVTALFLLGTALIAGHSGVSGTCCFSLGQGLGGFTYDFPPVGIAESRLALLSASGFG